MKKWGWFILALLPLLGAAPATTQTAGRIVCLIDVSGEINNPTVTFINRAVDEAVEQQAQCLIIRLDTPGGELGATQKIVQRFLSSPVPIAVYVAPPGAGAGSAGCFITLAADVAAMAPTTSIGAAHPVMVGGSQPLDPVMKEKLENFYGSYIETIANRHHRNAKWAKSSVQKSQAISAEEALKINVIDLIATDVPDLLRQIDGKTVRDQVLHTMGAVVVPIQPTLAEKFLRMLANPVLFYILLMVAIYGILGEVNNPGAIFPGVVGAIALVLVLFMTSLLPVSLVGILMIVLAFALFLIDVFAPTHGVLTAGGIVAFFIGSLLLFSRAEDFYRLSLSIIVPATVVTALFFLFVVGKGLAAQRLPVQVGRETLIGRSLPALSTITADGGKVFIEGEYWNAISDTPIPQGQTVQVVAVEGLTLKVRPLANQSPSTNT